MRTALCALALAAAAGCSDRPRAPALTNEPVYENDRAGLRFAAPAGWIMGLRAELPPGRLEKPLRLVRYQVANAAEAGPEKAADMSLMVIDLPAGTDFGKYLLDNPVGSEKWVPGKPVELTVNGVAATRYEFTATSGKKGQIRREVTAFRRGERVYFFMTTFAATDAASRDLVRQSVNSVVWTDS